MNKEMIPKNNLPFYLQQFNVKILDDKKESFGKVLYTTFGAIPSNEKEKNVWQLNLTGYLKPNINKYNIVYDFSKVEYKEEISFEKIISGTFNLCGKVFDASKIIGFDYKYNNDNFTLTIELDTLKLDFRLNKEVLFSYQLNIGSSSVHNENHSIRDGMLEYFKNNFNLDIDNSNQIYNYSPYKFNDNSIMIANVYREDDNTKPFHLEYFNMLYASHDGDVVKTIDMVCSFLKNFCNTDMQKLLIVSITENNKYSLPGIEPFINVFVKNGLRQENILIRKDVDNAVKLGEGDGYWRNPFNKNQKFPSFSILYPLHNDSSITDFNNKNKWLEIGEVGIDLYEKGFGMGVERLEYLFFSKPFPC